MNQLKSFHKHLAAIIGLPVFVVLKFHVLSNTSVRAGCTCASPIVGSWSCLLW